MVTSFAMTTSRRRGEMRKVGTLVPWRNSPAIAAGRLDVADVHHRRHRRHRSVARPRYPQLHRTIFGRDRRG